jgi:hypothetical protein
MNLCEALTVPENLYWAWEKVRSYYRQSDVWFDEAEVMEFELHLDSELRGIANQLKRKKYRTSPLKPLPQPKACDENRRPRVRQAFWVRVRDQVAWLAYVNVAGPLLDLQMPAWSYGNRLYRSAWFEESDGKPRLKIGPYRHSAGRLYRPFQQSWPLYRRYVYLTIRQMASPQTRAEIEIGEAENRLLQIEQSGGFAHRRLAYLLDGYWQATSKAPCWAGIDLKKFYQSIDLGALQTTIAKYLAPYEVDTGDLVTDLLSFRLDLTGWSDEALELMDLSSRQHEYRHIPTGLMAAGFLANVAMLPIDELVGGLCRDQQIAQFRYVDDHIILAPDFESLVNWIRRYSEILRQSDLGVSFNSDKIEPEGLRKFMAGPASDFESADTVKIAREACVLDPRFPSPLMTQTLGKVSEIAKADFDLMDEREQEDLQNDLEYLLQVPLPDAELPHDTRVSFAAGRLARLAGERHWASRELIAESRRLHEIEREIKERAAALLELRLDSDAGSEALDALSGLQSVATAEREKVSKLAAEEAGRETREDRRVLALLVRALHDCPEKVRLWEKVLHFTAAVGIDPFPLLSEELNGLIASAPFAYKVVRARLTQVVSRQLVRCAYAIRNGEATLRRRKAGLLYIDAVLRRVALWNTGDQPAYYESAATDFLRFATGAAIALLKQAVDLGTEAESDEYDLLEATRSTIARNDGMGLSERDLRGWAESTGHSLAVWVWWAEQNTVRMSSTEPGPLWSRLAELCDPSNPESWTLWQRYPFALSESMIQRIRLASEHLRRESLHWLAQVILEVPSEQAPELVSLLPPRSRRGVIERLSPKGGITLTEWANWTDCRFSDDPFDPRTGEWTALEIVRQVTNQMQRKTGDAWTRLRPMTITVPSEWRMARESPSWEGWRDTMSRSSIRVIEKPALNDARFAPLWPGQTSDADWAPLRVAAMLLLGLLRRSFRWPAAWNPIGQERTHQAVARELVRTSGCSSWTLGILEACLMPRQRETFLLPLFQSEDAMGEQDTTLDPPPITDVAALARYLRVAQSVLRRHQVTVQEKRPRQLVPVALRQLTNEQWAEDLEEVLDA